MGEIKLELRPSKDYTEKSDEVKNILNNVDLGGLVISYPWRLIPRPFRWVQFYYVSDL